MNWFSLPSIDLDNICLFLDYEVVTVHADVHMAQAPAEQETEPVPVAPAEQGTEPEPAPPVAPAVQETEPAPAAEEMANPIVITPNPDLCRFNIIYNLCRSNSLVFYVQFSFLCTF